MSSNTFGSSYRQYKTDTSLVASWLANTAQQCGYPHDRFAFPRTSQSKAPKLKGRARKLAREAELQNPSKSQVDGLESRDRLSDSQYLITVNDFVLFAEWIAKSARPRVDVPGSVVSVLDRAITMRKRHSDWWCNRSDNDGDNNQKEDQANSSHGHFIGVLDKVREILRPRMPKGLRDRLYGQAARRLPTPGKATDGHMVNLFENLDVEDTTDAPLDPKSPALGQERINTMRGQYSVNPPVSDFEEVYFAVHCLLSDFYQIRKYLQEVWKSYNKGAIDLVVASITTNTAFDFARCLQEDFTKAFPDHTDFGKQMSILYVQLCIANNQDPESKEQPDDEINFAIYDDAESMFLITYGHLSSYIGIIGENNLPIYRPGTYGVYDAASDRTSKSSRDRFREDMILLLEILPDFCYFSIVSSTVKGPVTDEIACAVQEMITRNEVPIWLAFAAQVFLDIHHTFREKVSKGFNDLVKSAKYIENNIEQVLRYHAGIGIKNSSDCDSEELFLVMNHIKQWVHTDVMQDARTRFFEIAKFESPPEESFLFLKYNPLYCGLLSFSLKALAQTETIDFVNSWHSISTCAHLYNALRQERLVSSAWTDMDLALLMHESKDIFVGDFPKTIIDYSKRINIALGTSIVMSARNRRNTGFKNSKAGRRVLNNISPVSEVFWSRYRGTEGRAPLSPNDVETILTKTIGDQYNGSSESEMSPAKVTTNGPEKTHPTPHTKSGKSRRPQKGTTQTEELVANGVRPIRILDALLHAIDSEMLELNFDHLRLHTVCWNLLRGIQQVVDKDLHKIFGSMYQEEDNQLPFIVSYIFTAAEMKDLVSTLVSRKELEPERLLDRAAEVMNTMLEAGIGRLEVSMLKARLGFEVEPPDLFGQSLP
ncbi:MAG: hypothetical protein M1812_005934 [Candelaria pacifica]|nr:MAG: hypothetical protein M1812_005934 [Candelaria pacifica]